MEYKDKVNKIAKLILYTGPTLNEIIENNESNNIEVTNNMLDNTTEVIIRDIISYDVIIKDKYIYDGENKLIKHILFINEREEILFDKYKELNLLLSKNIIKTA